MGKSTISMAIFHCYVSSPEGMCRDTFLTHRLLQELFQPLAGWKIRQRQDILAAPKALQKK